MGPDDREIIKFVWHVTRGPVRRAFIPLCSFYPHPERVHACPTNTGRRVVGFVSPMTRVKNTNKHPAMLRLPVETLVHIIKLVQRTPRSGPTSLISIGALGDDLYDLRWYKVMSVCSHLRVIAIRSPALWSFIDTRWPRTFVDLCLSRALPYPLQILARVVDDRSSLLAQRLLHHARDAEIIFGGPGPAAIQDPNPPYRNGTLDEIPGAEIGPDRWRVLCQRVLRTASKLRSLTITLSAKPGSEAHLILQMAKPILGGERSMITRLDLAQVRLMDPPDMPCLTHLQFNKVVPPLYQPTWLQHWLVATPNLHVFSMTAKVSAIAAPAEPVPLPYLEDFAFVAPFEMT
jgi:hypothetical protein